MQKSSYKRFERLVDMWQDGKEISHSLLPKGWLKVPFFNLLRIVLQFC